MFDLEGPEDAVQDVAGHVAERAVAEVIPAVPLVRVQVAMVFSKRRRADPIIPVEARWRRNGGRARACAAVRAVGPAMGFGDLSDASGPDEFTKTPVTVLAMTLVSHLGGGFGLTGHVTQLPGFGDVVAERLFAIHGFAQVHSQHGRQSVLMIGRSDK